MFIVCVTDTQPKECKGVLKRLMDVVTVDFGEPLTDFVMKENEGCGKAISHRKGPHIESQIQSSLQALHCTRTSECFTITNVLFLFLQQYF